MINNSKHSIYKKKQNEEEKNIIVLKNDIMNKIPEDAKNRHEEDQNLAQTKTEFRWRFFKTSNDDSDDDNDNDNKMEFMELSMKKQGEPRLFFNHYGNWVEGDEKKYDKYIIIKKYYAYI